MYICIYTYIYLWHIYAIYICVCIYTNIYGIGMYKYIILVLLKCFLLCIKGVTSIGIVIVNITTTIIIIIMRSTHMEIIGSSVKVRTLNYCHYPITCMFKRVDIWAI